MAIGRLRMADSVPIVVILGATGAGKSKLALELALKFGGEIINADAMQMYRGLDIVTNKVTAQEQAQVKHHMINILDPLDTNNVVDFRNRALPIVERLMREGKIPFICGGTNYYIESLLWKILLDQEMPLFISDSRKRTHESAISDEESVVNGPLQKDDKGKLVLNVENLDSFNFEDDDNSVSSSSLFNVLKTVDPERALMLHPNERRKVWRSLQVYVKTKKKHSEIIKEQGPGALGGDLRFPKEKICLIEVWSDQEVLDARCDGRVEKMIERGLIAELTEFHEDYNKKRDVDQETLLPNYTQGIWQSIGFKEFHPYLILTPQEREKDEDKLFDRGVEWMKLATRQYSRKQVKWMRRFLLAERDPPPYYRVDSSTPSLWQEAVYLPAEAIVSALLEGRSPEQQPLPLNHKSTEILIDERKTFHCDICNREFKGSSQFKTHINSKPHKKLVNVNMEPYELVVMLEKFPLESRKECARILKNTFEIGYTEIFPKMDVAPCEISVIPGRGNGLTKVKNIMRELEKHDIKLSYTRRTIQKDSQVEQDIEDSQKCQV